MSQMAGLMLTLCDRYDELRHSKTTIINSVKTTTIHAWDINDIVADITAYGTTSESKATYLRGNGLVYAKIGDSGHYFYQKNAHGDVVQYLNVKGNPDHTYKYSAFGVELSSEGPAKNPFRYCGEYFDTENGSIYLRARHYVPGVGRFTQEDTHWNPGNMVYGDSPLKVGASTGTYAPSLNAIKQSANLYTYCGNDPVRYVDTNGEIFMLVTGALGALAGGIGGAIYSYVKYGEIRLKNVAAGAAIGGAVGLTGGAAAAYISTGTTIASTASVLHAGASWATALSASGATSSAALGRTFEKWFYSFNNIAQRSQQVIVNGIGRIDAFKNGTIYELKNYNWSKYSNFDKVISDFVKQAQRYQQIGQVNGEKVKNVVFYFSSKPPIEVIKALKGTGAKVQWVP